MSGKQVDRIEIPATYAPSVLGAMYSNITIG